MLVPVADWLGKTGRLAAAHRIAKNTKLRANGRSTIFGRATPASCKHVSVIIAMI
jgi:hypothetical protein